MILKDMRLMCPFFGCGGSDGLFYVDIRRLLMRSISNVIKFVERNKIHAHCRTNGPIMTVVSHSALHHKEIQKRKSRFLFITFKFKTVRDLFMLVAVAMSMRRTKRRREGEGEQVKCADSSTKNFFFHYSRS